MPISKFYVVGVVKKLITQYEDPADALKGASELRALLKELLAEESGNIANVTVQLSKALTQAIVDRSFDWGCLATSSADLEKVLTTEQKRLQDLWSPVIVSSLAEIISAATPPASPGVSHRRSLSNI